MISFCNYQFIIAKERLYSNVSSDEKIVRIFGLAAELHLSL